MGRGREAIWIGLALALSVAAVGAIWLPFLPNAAGRVSVDFSLWLPSLLAGDYWHLRNGWLALPWFSPAQCGGLPYLADPQVGYIAVPQWLSFLVPPLDAVRITLLLFAGLGFLGAWWLARRRFALGPAAALFAGAAFAVNAFFGVRMAVGHLTYAPFMLLPAVATLLLTSGFATAILAGILIAAMVQAGMVHIVPPAYLSLAMLFTMHGMAFGASRAPWLRLGFASLVAIGLCAGKLAAGLALVSHFPRNDYPLPGFASLWTALSVAFQSLFLQPDRALTRAVVHSRLVQERHEFEYGVSVAPLLLMLAAAGAALWQRRRPRPRAVAGGALLALLIAIPILLNWYQPAWNAWLKSLPFFGSSSNLLRWFAAYILPAVIGGAIALDWLARQHAWLGAGLAAAGIAIAPLTEGLADHRYYGRAKLGFYDALAIEAAWRQAQATGAPPPIRGTAMLLDPSGNVMLSPERQNALTQGFSQFFCYAPQFGYRLERFPFGKLHPGYALELKDGVLNFKNPACYVFPRANDCAPGDEFRPGDRAALAAFLDYRPLAFKKPWWAHLADAVNALTLIAVMAALGWRAFRRVAGWKSGR